MKSSSPGSAHWRSSNTSTVVARSAIRSKNVRHAVYSSSGPPGGASPNPSKNRSGPSIVRRSVGIRHEFLERCPDPRPAGRLVVALHQPGPAADHLAQRPERDPLAVRRRSPLVPVHDLEHAVDVLQELPREPALADPALAGDRDQSGPPLAGGCMEEVPQQPQFFVAADEGRLEAFGPPLARRAWRRRGVPARRAPATPCRAGPGRPPLRRRSTGWWRAGSPRRPARCSGGATDWSRLAVLTRSPATMPWLVAPSVTAASPVSTAARASRPRPSAPGPAPGPTRSGRARSARRARRRPPARSACPTPP